MRVETVAVDVAVVVYWCQLCDFSTEDAEKATQHVREMNRYTRNRWWLHEVRAAGRED